MREAPDRADYFRSTLFAESYAEYLVIRQFNYAEALKWSEQVKTRFKEQFIKFYISQFFGFKYKSLQFISSILESL